jgi:hypothetical protein
VSGDYSCRVRHELMVRAKVGELIQNEKHNQVMFVKHLDCEV